MQKIEFRIDFIDIVYKLKTKKAFSIRLTEEDEDGSSLREEVIDIPSDRNTIQLSKIPSFQSFFVFNQDKTFYVPHNIYFIVDRTPIIRRRIPLHLSKVYDHFYNRPFEKEIIPIEQIYTFEEGKILYSLTLVKSCRVVDQEELQNYEQKLSQFSSLNSSRIVKQTISQSMANKDSNYSRKPTPKPSYYSECNDQQDKLEAQETLELDESSEKGINSHLNYLESWQEFSLMEKQHSQIKATPQPEIQKSSHSKGFALKFIIALVTIGFLLLGFDAYSDPELKVKGIKNKKQNKSTKAGIPKIKKNKVKSN